MLGAKESMGDATEKGQAPAPPPSLPQLGSGALGGDLPSERSDVIGPGATADAKDEGCQDNGG